MAVKVVNNTEASRFEIYVDDARAGLADYKPAGENRAFVHTEISDEYSGQGLAKQLIQTALDETRDEGLGALPFCVFVNGFIGKNRDYLDMVPEWARERMDLPAD
jgi:predicted GNAT family acetyltransferase